MNRMKEEARRLLLFLYVDFERGQLLGYSHARWVI